MGKASEATVLDWNLQRVKEKLLACVRLDLQDGIDCLTTSDLFDLSRFAVAEKRRRYGRKGAYVFNRQINPTNICLSSCSFCRFPAQPDSPEGYEMTIQEVLDARRDMCEGHIVGGLHPKCEYEYYPEMIRNIREQFPGIQIKARTAVEIDFFGKKAKKDVREVLAGLKEAGLDAMTSGGA